MKINKWKEKKKQPDERQLEITRLHEQYRQATAICGADAPETLACIEKLHQNTSNFIHKFIWDHGPGVQTKDVHNELYNILYITFREALPSYDPDRGTLTTFLTAYFQHALSEYQRNDTLIPTSAYYSSMAKKIRTCTEDNQSEGQTWTVEALSQKTGLSPRTVKETLLQMDRRELYSFEDAGTKISSDSAETTCINNYKKQDLIDHLSRLLLAADPLSVTWLTEKYLEKKTYKQIARETGISESHIKAAIKELLKDLSNDPVLQEYYKSN